MALIAIGGLALGAYSAAEQRKAADAAERAQRDAIARSMGLTREEYLKGQEELKPWKRLGAQALEEQKALLGMGGDTAGALRSLQSTPGYTSGLALGSRSLEASSAARGGMGSGKSTIAAQQYGQDYANQAIQNRLSTLSGISAMGKSSAEGAAGLGRDYAGTLSSLLSSGANAQGAAGIYGSQASQSSLLGGAQLGLAGWQSMNRNRNPYLTQPPAPIAQTPDPTWSRDSWNRSSLTNY